MPTARPEFQPVRVERGLSRRRDDVAAATQILRALLGRVEDEPLLRGDVRAVAVRAGEHVPEPLVDGVRRLVDLRRLELALDLQLHRAANADPDRDVAVNESRIADARDRVAERRDPGLTGHDR